MKTLDRGLEILEHIVQATEGVTIRELSAHTSLDRSTIYRYLKVLLKHRLIAHTDINQRYVGGHKVLELSSHVLRRLTIRDLARPRMIDLAQQVALTVHLGILDDNRVLYLEKIESQESLPTISRVGSLASVHSTALGKALLAHEDAISIERVIATIAFEQRTAHTISSPEAFRVALSRVRSDGYALDEEENEEGVHCVAAPVWGHTGRVVAALSMSGLARQYNDRARKITALLQTSSDLSRALGASGSVVQSLALEGVIT